MELATKPAQRWGVVLYCLEFVKEVVWVYTRGVAITKSVDELLRQGLPTQDLGYIFGQPADGRRDHDLPRNVPERHDVAPAAGSLSNFSIVLRRQKGVHGPNGYSGGGIYPRFTRQANVLSGMFPQRF